jgi:pimeloyl-ACP methyl ester carboxylesterase
VVETAAETDGAVLAYGVRGAGPPDVLCLHGWAGTGAAFDRVIGALDTTRLRTIAPDLRGHGGSGGDDAEYTLELLTADVLATAEAAGADEFVVLGFSMGAKFAQHLALTAPDRVAGLVLVAGCPAGEIPLPPELVADWNSRAGDTERLAELTLQFTANPVEPTALDAWARNAAAVSPAALAGTLTATIATSFAAEVGAISVRTLVVGGTSDAIFTPEVLRDTVAAPITGARLALLDAGHELLLEKPHELAALIQAFLAGLGR